MRAAVWLPTLSGFLLIATLSIPAAASSAPRERLAEGIEHYQSGDLESARTAFEDARAAGLESPSLVYNLGVVYYRLGEYRLAAATFSMLLETENNALAQYNLGLVARAAGDAETADAWFARAASRSSPPKIRALAEAQLQPAEAVASSALSQIPRMGYISLSGGYDNNIASVPEAGSSGREGGFGELLAAGSADVYQFDHSLVRLEGAAYSRQYPSESEFDTDLLQVGAGWLRELGPGRAEITAGVSQSWFDADQLERTYRLDVSYRLNPCPFAGPSARCQATVSSGVVEGGDGFEAYDGEWYQARLKARKDYADWRVDLQYRGELNSRDDLTAGDQFVSVSPQRHMAEVALRYKVSQRWHVGVAGNYRYSRYADPHRLFDDAGVLDVERRIDQRTQGTLLTEFALSAAWSLRGEWMFRDNQSTLERYDYRRQMAMVGIEGLF